MDPELLEGLDALRAEDEEDVSEQDEDFDSLLDSSLFEAPEEEQAAVPAPTEPVQGPTRQRPQAQEGAGVLSHVAGRVVGGLAGATVASPLKSISILGKKLNDVMPDFLKEDDYVIEDRLLYQMGQAIEDFVNENMPADPRLQDSFIADTLPQAIGSLAGFFVGGAAGKVMKLGAGSAASTLGIAAGAAGEYDKAVMSGATAAEAELASLLGAALGVTEGLPVGRAFGRFVRPRGVVSSGILGAAEEATQELFQGSGSIAIEAQYNENLTAEDAADDLIGGTAAGGITGFLANAAMAALGRRGGGGQQVQPQEGRSQGDGQQGSNELIDWSFERPEELPTPAMSQNGEMVKGRLQEVFQLPEDQADAVARIVEARASVWAEQHGRSPEEWYQERLGAIVKGKDAPGDAFLQSLWHGSPHEVKDEFSTQFINTGEGTQWEGWGLYFTEREGVARYYAEKEAARRQTPSKLLIKGKEVPTDPFFNHSGMLMNDLLGFLEPSASNVPSEQEFEQWRDLRVSSLQRKINEKFRQEELQRGNPSILAIVQEQRKEYEDALSLLESIDFYDIRIEEGAKPKRNVYNVELDDNAEIVNYHDQVDWDKLDKVIDALDATRIGKGPGTGKISFKAGIPFYTTYKDTDLDTEVLRIEASDSDNNLYDILTEDDDYIQRGLTKSEAQEFFDQYAEVSDGKGALAIDRTPFQRTETYETFEEGEAAVSKDSRWGDKYDTVQWHWVQPDNYDREGYFTVTALKNGRFGGSWGRRADELRSFLAGFGITDPKLKESGEREKKMTWWQAYDALAAQTDEMSEVSKAFKDAGISGLKYRGSEKSADYYNYVVWDEEALKIKNRIQYQRAVDPDRRAKGAVQFVKDGRAIIFALEQPDVSTAVHEFAHIFRRDLEGADLVTAENWAGVKDGSWSVEAEEKWARGFERYLRSGKAPNEQLRSVFQKMKEWLSKIYQAIKGSPIDVNLNPEIVKVFDNLLTTRKNTVQENNREVEQIRAQAEAAVRAAISNADPRKKKELYQQLVKNGFEDLATEVYKSDKSILVGTTLEPPKNAIEGVLRSSPMQDIGDLETVGLAKADIELIRRGFGLQELPPNDRRKWAQSLHGAILKGAHKTADQTARAVIEKPQQISDIEYAGLVIRSAELMKAHDDMLRDMEQLTLEGDRFGASNTKVRADAVLEALDNITRAADISGRETARALSVRRMRISTENFSPTMVIRQGTINKMGPLTLEETQDLTKKADAVVQGEETVADLESRHDELVKEKLKENAKKVVARELKKRAKQEDIDAEIEQAKKALGDLGLRFNNIFGLGAEGAYRLGQLAIALVKKGTYRTLDEVTTYITTLNPDIEDIDVYEAINTRNPKHKARSRSEARARVAHLKAEAGLMARIEALERGLPLEPPTKGSKVNEDIKALRHWLNKLEAQAFKGERDEARLQRMVLTIQELRKLLNVQTADANNLKTAKDLLTDLRALKKDRAEITDLQEQLRTGNFKEKPKKPERVRLPELEKARIDLAIARKEVKLAIENLKPYKVKHFKALGQKPGEARWNAIKAQWPQYVAMPRAMLATADMSYVLRQGLVVSLTRPALAGKAFIKGFEAYWSRTSAEGVDLSLREDPMHVYREAYGLYLAPLEVGSANAREEAFMSRIAQKMPFFGKVMRASERNMVTGLNILRAGIFDDFMTRNRNATETELRAFADYINVTTGRGKLDPKNAQFLSHIFFAPRFAVSRFQTPQRWVKYANIPSVRKEMARDVVGLAGFGAVALALASAAGAEIGGDPRESDFGKIVIGNTRIDIWGGLLQPMRFVTRILTGITDRSGLTGKGLSERQKEIDVRELISNFAFYKMSPAVNIPIDLIQGENVVGEEVTPEKMVLGNTIPLFAQEIWKAGQQEGIVGGALVAAPVFFGMGISSYGTEMDKPDVRAVLKKYDYRPRLPEYPSWVEEDEKMKKEMDEMFEAIFVMRLREESTILDVMPKRDAKDRLELLTAEARSQVLGITGKRNRKQEEMMEDLGL
jgi:hypothetical protein